MSQEFALNQVPGRIEQAEANASGIEWIVPFEKADSAEAHELVFFLKPELLLSGAGVKLPDVIGLIERAFAAYDLAIGSLAILTAKYLKEHAVMQAHYGVINKVSREGRAALSEDARAKLDESFGKLTSDGADVLGGHQILDTFPGLTPSPLNEIWERKRSVKLAGGTYAIDIEVDGRTLIALNGFHPDQIDHFIAPGRRIAVATVRSGRAWADLRGKLVGATDPAKAPEGSIRRALLDRKDELGLAAVNQGFNGVHLSAGPLEGLVELVRFTSDRAAGTTLDVADTCFGLLLAQAGFSRARTEELMSNLDLIVGGKIISAFDLTEEVDAAGAVEALSRT